MTTDVLRTAIIDAGLASGWDVQLDVYQEKDGKRIILLRPMQSGGITAGQIGRQAIEVWCVGLGKDSPAVAKAKAQALEAFFNTPANNGPIYQTRVISGIMPFKVSDDRKAYLLTIDAYSSRNEVF